MDIVCCQVEVSATSCTRPEESYRLWCVVVCDLETSRMGAPYIYDISSLKVNGIPVCVILYTPIRNVRLPVFCLSRNWKNHNEISYTEFYSNRKISTENRSGNFCMHSSTLRRLLCRLSQNLKNLINFSENLPCEVLYKKFKSAEIADKI